MTATVYDYFQAAFRRAPAPLACIPGETVRDGDGNAAAITLAHSGGIIHSAAYRCTSCVTLMALCEHLCQLLAGMTISAARGIAPESLLELHPEIPPSRQDRAVLVVRALQSAINSSCL